MPWIEDAVVRFVLKLFVMQKILFIGATGLLGKPVARELIREGFDITLLARDEARMRSLFPGTTVVAGDVFNKTSIVKAMQGMDGVYCNLSVLPTSKEAQPQPEREGIDTIIAAAKETGIRRIAYLSSLVHRYEGMNGFSWWAFRIKEAAVQKIKSSGIPYTIFYPSTFMDTYLTLVQGSMIPMIGRSEMPMWFIAAADYARQVSTSYRLLRGESKDYVVQGPQALTWDEANNIYISNYRYKKLKTMTAPGGLMKFLGAFNRKMNYASHICEALNKYPEKFESEQTWKELGKPSVTLAEFARNL